MSAPLKTKSTLEMTLECGLYLVVNSETDPTSRATEVDAALYIDSSACPRLAFFIAYDGEVRVASEAEGIWFKRALLSLEWHDLLRVADFLHLDIPQPELPTGQEVPR